MSFNYFEYGVGDCLSMHTDTDSGDVHDLRRAFVQRRIAVTSYVHDTWAPDWLLALVLERELRTHFGLLKKKVEGGAASH